MRARQPARSPTRLAQYRAALHGAREALRESYLRQPRPGTLLREHARAVDATVQALWRDAQLPAQAALVATGGYGRLELFPHSDIDLLVLLPADPDGEISGKLERLVGEFWDVGLEVRPRSRAPAIRQSSSRRKSWSRSSVTPSTRTPPTRSSPTSRRRPAGCATCRSSSGSRARAAWAPAGTTSSGTGCSSGRKRSS